MIGSETREQYCIFTYLVCNADLEENLLKYNKLNGFRNIYLGKNMR